VNRGDDDGKVAANIKYAVGTAEQLTDLSLSRNGPRNKLGLSKTVSLLSSSSYHTADTSRSTNSYDDNNDQYYDTTNQHNNTDKYVSNKETSKSIGNLTEASSLLKSEPINIVTDKEHKKPNKNTFHAVKSFDQSYFRAETSNDEEKNVVYHKDNKKTNKRFGIVSIGKNVAK
jgi:hypothetical protein